MLHDLFLTGDAAIGTAISYSYDHRLVALSIVTAAFASYTGFHTLDRYTAGQRRITRLAWLLTGALTLGGGIWSMHFIAMMAVDMGQPMTMRYNVALTALSAGFAVIACGLAMKVMVSGRKPEFRIVIGGVVLGAGIGLMHYTGMAAMRMPAGIRYDPMLFGASIVLAVALSSLALHLLRSAASRPHAPILRAGSAVLMALSISSMHYTGMAATYFVPGRTPMAAAGLALDHESMAVALTVCVFVAMSLAVSVSVAHRHYQQKDRELTNQGIYLEKIVHNAVDGIVMIKPDGEIMVANPVFERFFGYDRSELVGCNIAQLMNEDAAGKHAGYLLDAQTNEPHILDNVRELIARRKDGSYFPIDLAVSSIEQPDGRYFMGVARDVTERKEAEEQQLQMINELLFNKELLEEQAACSATLAEELDVQKRLVEENMRRSDYLARHDTLTDLPNRRYFFERLEQVLANPPGVDTTAILLCIDLDKFKPINDIMGHERGDALLTEVAEKLTECIRDTDMAARLGGDEFAVLAMTTYSANNAAAWQMAERIRDALRIPVETPGETIVTSASIGVALFPQDGRTIDDLMKSADMAMYEAKHGGRDQVRFSDGTQKEPLKQSA